ncbi:hypothetical protein [Mycolicibacterium wolinskyi]|uniref:hypothetical protein n=1 Tax=Mycolicibacterium wolinskyi TaxID=59750 RepID=UPI0009FC9363|nr:hypothetical protein [Mycolicibacterium wolinskyi]
MSEPTSSDIRVRVAPKDLNVGLESLTILVRVPHNPTATAAFTTAQKAEAERYAAEQGGICTPLPVPDPVWDWETGTRKESGQERRDRSG